MSTYTRNFPGEIIYTANGTGACFAGSSSDDTYSQTVGGSITSNSGPVHQYRRKIGLGINATSTYAGDMIDIDYSSGYCYARKLCKVGGVDRWATQEWSGVLVNSILTLPDAPVGSIDSTADAQARTRFARNARSAQGSFRGATFVAELGDVLRGIRDPARGIRGLIDAYSNRNRTSIRRATGRDPGNTRVSDLSDRQRRAAARAVSDSWLEYQFGVLPLMSDMRDAYRSYRRLAKRQPTTPVNGEATVLSSEVKRTRTRTVNMLTVSFHGFEATELSVRYRGAVKLQVHSHSASVIEEAGFRTRDFIPALWEWIPYSFLVDYFVNIGDLLEAASVPRSDMAWMNRTWRNVAYRDYTRGTVSASNSFVYPQNGTIQVLEQQPSSVFIRRKKFSRAIYSGSLVPQLRFQMPGFENFKRYLNIAALASSRGMRR